MLLLGKHPHFYLFPLLRQSETVELSFALAEAIILCTLWSLAEQIANCKVFEPDSEYCSVKGCILAQGFCNQLHCRSIFSWN